MIYQLSSNSFLNIDVRICVNFNRFPDSLDSLFILFCSKVHKDKLQKCDLTMKMQNASHGGHTSHVKYVKNRRSSSHHISLGLTLFMDQAMPLPRSICTNFLLVIVTAQTRYV